MAALLCALALACALVACQRVQENAGREEELRTAAKAAVRWGVLFLDSRQSEAGEFPTYGWWGDEQPRSWWRVSRRWYVGTPFTASQILHSLTFVEDDETVRRVRERAVAYLLAEREPPGVWRYYAKRRPPHVLSPDVDDAAQAWAALFEQGIAVDPRALEVLKASRMESGLFTTWIGDPSQWVGVDSNEVSIIVNLNALFLFALVGEPLPEVCRHVITYTKTNAFQRGALYYPSPLAYTYFLTRAYADGRASCLIEAVPAVRSYVLEHQQPDGGWGNDLETALGALTLLNVGEDGPAVRQGIRTLLGRQGLDDAWRLAPLYRGASRPIYYGSSSLTTGFCLEALGKYLRR